MSYFQIHFTADNLPYRITIQAITDGQAQDKFVRWFTERFKPERGILGVAKVTRIVAVNKNEEVKKTLKDYFKFRCIFR